MPLFLFSRRGISHFILFVLFPMALYAVIRSKCFLILDDESRDTKLNLPSPSHNQREALYFSGSRRRIRSKKVVKIRLAVTLGCLNFDDFNFYIKFDRFFFLIKDNGESRQASGTSVIFPCSAGYT